MSAATEAQLRKELAAHGAREVDVAALSVDPDRGLAALRVAVARGVERPVPYALHLFDATDWQPSGDVKRRETNTFAEVRCEKCNGDRFVSVTDDPHALYGETYAPCAGCNAEVNAGFWRVDGTRVKVVAR